MSLSLDLHLTESQFQQLEGGFTGEPVTIRAFPGKDCIYLSVRNADDEPLAGLTMNCADAKALAKQIRQAAAVSVEVQP